MYFMVVLVLLELLPTGFLDVKKSFLFPTPLLSLPASSSPRWMLPTQQTNRVGAGELVCGLELREETKPNGTLNGPRVKNNTC